jgi:uncharacterized protein (TIGR02246 family)
MNSTLKRLRVSWMILIVLGLFVGCGTQVRTNDPSDIAAIKAMSAARAKAFNERNAGAIAIHFTEDGLLMAPGAPLTSGREAVERYYQAIFDQYVTGLESGYEDVSVSGDLAYGRGFAKVMLIANDGRDTVHSTAKYINILRRQPDGSWLTTHDIWNADE